MTTFRDNPYRWQLRALVAAVQKYDCAIDESLRPVQNTTLAELDRLYHEMIGELEMSVLILGGEEMVHEPFGNA
jgi:hypothetical protein